VLPDGMSYKLLVIDLDEPVIPLKVLQKINELVKEGATLVLGETVPVRVPGINNYQEDDQEVKRLAEEFWGSSNKQKQVRSLGEGTIYTGYKLNEVLADRNILPDFEGPFEYLHRKSANQDIYFVSGAGDAECIFRIEGKKPEIWNPVTGQTTEAAVYRHTNDGRTQVMLNLPENGSAFIVFKEKTDENSFTNIVGPEIPELSSAGTQLSEFTFWKEGSYQFRNSEGLTKEIDVRINSPLELSDYWEVSFEPATGANKMNMTFEKLVLWNEHQNKDIKYFSGTAIYSKYFNLTAEQASSPARLQLGSVHDISRVWLNGNDLGIIWTNPWSVNLNENLKEGVNELKIEVTNCWANRLIGDAGLTEGKRTTRTNVRLVPDRSEYPRGHQATSAIDLLMPSGLIGPVKIEFGKSQQIIL
jgi:hypothetical protein